MRGGLYVHFPYCEHHCSYCDFVVATPRKIPQTRFTDAIVRELKLRASAFSAPAETLYLGGGTPSLWASDELGRLLDAIRASPGLSPDAEVTLEANPNDIDPARLSVMRSLGINRVSLGVQSFQDDLLQKIERRHDAETAREACEAIASAGFESYSIDLIFGLPGQDTRRWLEDLEIGLSFAPPHLSIYGLTVEARTPLERQVARGVVQVPDEGVQAEMMFGARERLQAAGYTHYEVSSYAKPGHRARHNGGYWSGRAYVGLGPGAHGFIPPTRWVNIRRPSRYIEATLSGEPTAESERLDEATRSYERVMTGLRDLEHGVDLKPDWERYEQAALRQVAQGNLTLQGTRARLSERGLRLMNAVLLDLL